ncbi:Acetolactate synthase, mitochondrial [Conoideocrella luteorostrata]|uniref:acetolactate synthase n=1 Tax=Conoideocrella luteorostrata TaxID=1105319 RepID=A0AAJ0CX15_9HYPO|nr:Acetolactate synthase, mitochondrial [Conoideocrella luteorostrata]
MPDSGRPGCPRPLVPNQCHYSFQEADVIVAELPRRVNEAFEIATSGRPGPVLVDHPKDVTAGILRKAIPAETVLPSLGSAASRAAMDHSQKQLQASIKRVADLVNIAKQPVIYAGQGNIQSENGPELLRELAKKSSIPVTTALHGLGGFDELDEKSLHMLGMHGSAYANMAMQEADLIIALGSRFDDRAAAQKRGGIVHFEIMPKNINKAVQATEVIEGDVAASLKLLLPEVQSRSMEDRTTWFDKIRGWKQKWPLSHSEQSERNGLIKPQSLIEEFSNLTADRKHKTYIATGVGQHQMWTAQHFRWRHARTMITSGGLGTMGYGLPAAKRGTGHDFQKLDEPMRVQSRRLIDPADTVESLKWLINSESPALLEVVTDKKVPVLPKVPAGSALHEFLVFDGEKDKRRTELMKEGSCGLHG